MELAEQTSIGSSDDDHIRRVNANLRSLIFKFNAIKGDNLNVKIKVIVCVRGGREKTRVFEIIDFYFFGEKTRVLAREHSEIVMKGGFLTISGDRGSRRISKMVRQNKNLHPLKTFFGENSRNFDSNF